MEMKLEKTVEYFGIRNNHSIIKRNWYCYCKIAILMSPNFTYIYTITFENYRIIYIKKV